MKREFGFSFLFAGICIAVAMHVSSAETALITGKLDGNILTAGSGKVMILGPDGKVLWEYKTALTHDAWMLPSGNILFADGASVTEVTPDKKVVFQYKAKEQKGGGSYACQRLENGNTMIAENSSGRILEVDKDGKVTFEMTTSIFKPGDHHNMRMARKLKNGNYLVCHSGAHVVKEYTPKGEVVLEIKTPNVAFSAVRTPQNTTLVGSLVGIIEYDAKGQKIWEFTPADMPGVTIRNMTGIQLLPNGNIATGCYNAYDKGEGTGLLEITRDKKLVWRYSNPSGEKTMMPIERLDANSKPLAGECLR
ncbi:MAG: hypothetical protein NTX50_14085 [Candidatus Sumerlaeota bacterium]|nr:hypothetical protein [Candidatus Sumerlaeota bacterium]